MKAINLLQQQQNFMQHLEVNGKSLNTLKNYQTDLNIFNQYLTQKGRKLEISELTLSELKDYNFFLEKKYNSPNSIRRRVQALRIFFDYLIQKEMIESNPVKKIIVSPKVVDKPNPTAFPNIQRLKDHFENSIENSTGHDNLLYNRNLILFYLIYGAGLKVSDIERVHQSHISEQKGSYRILIAHEKKEPYTVTLPPHFNSHYEAYLTLLSQGKERDQISFTQLFFNANPYKILKGGLSARGIEVIFKDLTKVLKFQITARSLRQACIFKWLGQGVPQSRIKEWMGVQPQYSLKPFEDLRAESPSDFAYMDL